MQGMRRLIPTLMLALTAVHHAQGEVNLALNKPAKQSSNYSSDHLADRAVNGVFDDSNDFSSTAERFSQWWQVDLERNFSPSKIELYNRQGYYERLRRVLLFTSILDSPTDSVSNWTRRHYQDEPYGAVGTKLLNRQIPARHLRVFSAASKGFALQEVMVYEERIFITAEAASQSGQSSYNPASAAIDGNLTTFSTTGGSDSHWWKATLQEKTLLKKAVVFAARLANASYVTSQTTTDTEPNMSGIGGWTLCFYSEQTLGEEYEIVCNDDYAYTKEFGIQSVGDEIRLREVQIFGYELPQLNKDIDGQTDSFNTTSVTVSFLQWNSDMVGEKPPYTYRVLANDTKMFILHEPNQERLTATFTNLSPGTEYTVEVSCKFYADYCPGPRHTFTMRTECAAPNTPVVSKPSCTKQSESPRQRWKCTITWQSTSANCSGLTTYVIDGSIHEETTSSNVDIYVDGGQEYHIGLRAKNSAGFYSSRTDLFSKADELAPQFGSSTFNVTGINSSCVMLAWEEPEYPGGDIQAYQYKCAEKGWKTVSTNVTSAQSCGHQPITSITCLLLAMNSLRSLLISAQGDTTSGQCTTPPTVKGAFASPTGNYSLGVTVCYFCENGQARLGGDNHLTCQLGEDGPQWVGSHLTCTKGIWEGFGTTIGCFVVALILAVCYNVKLQRRIAAGKRNDRETPATQVRSKSNPAANTKLGFDQTIQEKETEFNGDYAVVDGPQEVVTVYEKLNADKSGSDHVYESAQS